MEAPSTIKRYNLVAPTEQDLFASLDRLVGADESRRLWSTACDQAGIRRHQASLSMEQLESALQHLKQTKGLPSIAANSILVRVKGFRTLSVLNSI